MSWVWSPPGTGAAVSRCPFSEGVDKMDKGPGPRLNLLRGFTLTVGHERIPLIWSAQRLVAFLALRHRAVGRTVVAGTLWPETTSIKANANLRSSLWRAQRSCTHLVDASAQQLLLAPDVVVDVHRATKAAHRLLADGSCDEVLTGTTQADLSADLLPDWYDDDWILVDREQYHHLRLYALESMFRRLTASRRHGSAVDAGLAAERADPLRESAHHALIAAHLAAGNRCEAIRQYH